jgi:HK97 family phage major capsid protein
VLAIKAATAAATTTDASWAGPLVAYTVNVAEYAELLRPLTIIGRIPGLTRVPFNIQFPVENSSAQVGWVGENAPKPVSQGAFSTATLRWAKAAGITVGTEELFRFSNPAAEGILRNQMLRQMVQFLDRQFVDPAVAAVPNVSPGSITNGITSIGASGTTATALRTDITTLINSLLLNNQTLTGAVFIGTQQQAMQLSMMQNSLGQDIFPTMTPTGGTVFGIPYVASENLPAIGGSPANGYPLILAIAPEILLADDGTTLIDVSREASVQMNTTPDSPPTASTVLVSFWQNNLVGIRAERWITWQRRRATAVGYISNARYAA